MLNRRSSFIDQTIRRVNTDTWSHLDPLSLLSRARCYRDLYRRWLSELERFLLGWIFVVTRQTLRQHWRSEDGWRWNIHCYFDHFSLVVFDRMLTQHIHHRICWQNKKKKQEVRLEIWNFAKPIFYFCEFFGLRFVYFLLGLFGSTWESCCFSSGFFRLVYLRFGFSSALKSRRRLK